MKISKGFRRRVPATFVALVLLAASVLAVVGCGSQTGTGQLMSSNAASAVLKAGSRVEPSAAAKNDVGAVAASNNAFAFDLFAAMRPKDGNLVYSPYGLSAVLSMTMAGAKGETQREFARVLHLGLSEDRLYPALGALDSSLAGINDLTSASSPWGQSG
jgi:serine protease inhibitor